MIEVRCNGKIYVFDESSEIVDHLDMTAKEVRDEAPGSAGARKTVYTHDEAARIVEQFEDLLDAKSIEIPCSDADEQAERHDGGNAASLYGTEYSDLLDGVESSLIGILDQAGVTDYVPDEFSGDY